ncbi:uncharacterized protein L203_102126 [Cryptococcus depauperatus CBS 7841]|uniref:Uncharacterized protein n=1 Tax=Cryptococcus depauperatus CBS 7841 TaxID=1295531 RepID=A0A1E3IRU8_9TREE|nr:nuclear segregation protein Bfr1 [Cryptococcus depauperatus CBS 7841]
MPPPTTSQKPTAVKPLQIASTVKNDKKQIGHLAKPDQSKYNVEQDEINKEIAAVKVKLDAVRSRIALSQAPGSNDRRSALKAELEGLRTEQSKFKGDRNKLFDEMKRLQEGIQKKIKELQGSRGKLAYKSVDEVDDRIATLERQVESGNLKLVDEKKALQEITTLRRSRKTIESLESVEVAIAADKAKIEEVKKQLDDPEAKRVAEKFDQVKKEMDELREEGNKAFEEKGKLFDERNKYSAEMDELYAKKRQSAQKWREENDKYYAKIQADRQARQERFKAEKAREESERRKEEITRLREEARTPAYASEIEDCGVLINWLKGKYGSGEIPSTHAGGKSNSGASAIVEGVKQLEIRKVDEDAFKGMMLKKKDDDNLNGFFGGSGKGKKKGKKGGNGGGSGTATPASEGASGSKDAAVNLPMTLLSTLLSLGISPPSNKDDVQRTVDDLETKKAWFEANSTAKTKAEIERVERIVAKLLRKNDTLAEDKADDETDEEGEKGGVREPLHTVAIEGAITGPEKVIDHGEQLPEEGDEGEVKKVDSALEEIKVKESETA